MPAVVFDYHPFVTIFYTSGLRGLDLYCCYVDNRGIILTLYIALLLCVS